MHIELTQGQHAIVDEADFESLAAHKWHAYWNRHTRSFYAARRSPRVNGKQVWIGMHGEFARIS